jgi:GNAT superfamily N-acetyltransferase
MTNADIRVRPMAKADESFIYHSWLKSYRDSPTVRSIPNTIYFARHHDIIERLFNDPATVVNIACNPEDENQIYGYIVGGKWTGVDASGPVIHWIYVKHPFRGAGIGGTLEKLLVADAANVVFTHRVKQMDRLLKDKAYTYNPYLLGA